MKTFRQWLIEAYDEKKEKALQSFTKKLEKKHNVILHMYHSGEDLHLAHIEVPKENRKQGIGTAVLDDIHLYADRAGKRITLNLAQKDDKFGTTSSSRLRKFYKRSGYVDNKGRNKDFRTSASMFRRPKQ